MREQGLITMRDLRERVHAGALDTVILAFTDHYGRLMGKRFDHSLAALDAVIRYAAGRAIILVDEVDIALARRGPFSFTV